MRQRDHRWRRGQLPPRLGRDERQGTRHIRQPSENRDAAKPDRLSQTPPDASCPPSPLSIPPVHRPAQSRRGFMQPRAHGLREPELAGPDAAARGECAQVRRDERTAVIMVWLPGGLSHLDTLRPQARDRQRVPRPVQDDRHQGARACSSRNSAAARQDRRQVHDPALDEPRGRRPPGGLDADALGRHRRARQDEAEAAGLDVGGELPALERAASARTRCRGTSA